jgi:hypothetical protein
MYSLAHGPNVFSLGEFSPHGDEKQTSAAHIKDCFKKEFVKSTRF